MILKESSWKTPNNKFYPKLAENMDADIVIVGAGITGIFNAYILTNAGLKVVVLEKNEQILQNATMHTTAFVTKVIDTSFVKLISLFGQDKAKKVWQSGQDAIDLIATIVKKENIECEFEHVSIYTYAKNDKEFEKLSKEYEALKQAGFEANISKYGKELDFENSGFLEVPRQAKFHPILFAQALANIAESKGAKIFTNSEVIDIHGDTIKTKDYNVKTKDTLIATYSPLINKGMKFRKAMYISYMYEAEIDKDLIPEGLYLDLDNPYHYFRIDSYEKFDRMIVGGEDHRMDIKINPEKNYNALEKYIKSVLGANPYKLSRKWSGRILESIDGLPLIGEIDPHLFVATAFSGNGMTYAAISAMIVRDLIKPNKNPYTDVYSIKRKPTFKQLAVKGFDYIGEFFGGAFKNFFSRTELTK